MQPEDVEVMAIASPAAHPPPINLRIPSPFELHLSNTARYSPWRIGDCPSLFCRSCGVKVSLADQCAFWLARMMTHRLCEPCYHVFQQRLHELPTVGIKRPQPD